MKKSDREAIFNKFGGLCAYSGTKLEPDWQVDHIAPKQRCWFLNIESDTPTNMVPCQRIINHYKRSLTLDQFRVLWLGKLHLRIAKIPKNPRVERSIKRIAYIRKVASYFGITKDIPFSGIFYMERIESESKNG